MFVFFTIWAISALLGLFLLYHAVQFLTGKHGQYIGNGFTGMALGAIGVIPFLPIVVPGVALWRVWERLTTKPTQPR